MLGRVIIILSLLVLSVSAFAQQKMVYAQITGIPDQIIGAEVLTIAYKRMNIAVEFEFFSGKRALMESSKGNIDGEVNRIWEIGEAYPTLMRVPTAINVLETIGFQKKSDHYQVTKCADLNNLEVGVVLGIKHAEICAKDVKSIQHTNDSEFLMRMLALGRVEVGVEARLNGLVQIKKLKLGAKIGPLPTPLKKRLLYNYVHKKHVALIPKLDKILKDMKKNGEIVAIRERVIKRILGHTDDLKMQ